MTTNITLIIVTMERPALLKRALEWYARIPARIIIADGSVNPAYDAEPGGGVRYLHSPSKLADVRDFYDRIGRAAALIDTPYAALVADRRFCAGSGLLACVDFLDRNGDFSAAAGRYVSVQASEEGCSAFPAYQRFHWLDEDEPEKRLFSAYSGGKYRPEFYSVVRSEVWRDITTLMPRCQLNANLAELFVNNMICIHGKVASLPVLYSAIFPVRRDASYYRSSCRYDVTAEMRRRDFSKECDMACARYLAEKTGKDIGYCLRSVEEAMAAFVAGKNLAEHLRPCGAEAMTEVGELMRLWETTAQEEL